MRPRIRTIKPEALLHERLWDLEQETGLPLFRAFTGLWCFADREGRFEWRPRPLRAGILPYWNGDFALVLEALERGGFVERYIVGGRELGWVPSFKDHQAINQRESQSILPGPGDVDPMLRADVERSVSQAVNVPSEVKREIFGRDGQKCQRCASVESLTIDHIFPLSCGGNHAPSNLRVLCTSCNSARPTNGQALADDLARDDLTMGDLPRLCMHVSARAHTSASVRARAEEGRDIPVPIPSLPIPDPPKGGAGGNGKPQPDRFAASFAAGPAKRPDVVRVHAEWLRAFRLPKNTPLVRGWSADDAEAIAAGIDAHGEPDIVAMLRYAPQDPKVSGRSDDRGERHESIRYLFGENLPRLIRDAKTKARGTLNGIGSGSEIERRKREE